MSTTTIRLPEELKERVDKAAERTGKTPHNFILDAIAEKAEQEELKADFEAEAGVRFSRILETGETISWAEMRRYLKDRMQGKDAAIPVASVNS
ncbi:ribbon-helix-helix protein, CopG family [Pseudoduganella violacea]|uniref:Putative transcriptional regulator n=1 Tax=Pseudoduganella violacea TaxID=1715466 RepID=A0A7W5BA83_9BURK|nr:ribbon-helix-helix protein, CopG family [Pseudoduganella violacea]MBB3119429.1 putative transcriptional regulator [Pseudoduganella violacea]